VVLLSPFHALPSFCEGVFDWENWEDPDTSGHPAQQKNGGREGVTKSLVSFEESAMLACRE